MIVNILAVGDVCGPVGMGFIKSKLRMIKNNYDVSFCVVNGENAAGKGLTPRMADELLTAGADVITLGNHAYSKSEIAPYLDDNRYILRPVNYAPQNPGRGVGEFDTYFGKVRVINAIGRCGMDYNADNPFTVIDKVLKNAEPMITLVDFHAEATSESLAMGFHLDGRVSAVWGTHTHVQTSDNCIYPKGTGYVTDVGMVGAHLSVLGMKPEQAVSKFLGEAPIKFESGTGRGKFEACLFEINTDTFLCQRTEIIRIRE